MAALTRRKETVDPHVGLAVPFRLVGNELIEHTKRCVTDRLCQLVVTHHAPNVQVFGDDQIEAPHKVGSDLVHVVFSTVGDLLLNLGDLDALEVSAVASLLATGKHSLRLGKFRFVLADILWVGNPFAVAQCCQSGNTKIDADTLASFLERLNIFVKAESNKVVTDRRLGYRHGGRATCKLSAPTNIQSPDLGNGQALGSTVPFESGGGVLSGLARLFLLEAWVLTALVKEVVESGLQVPQSLLWRHTRNFVQPSMLCSLLERGQHGGRSVVVDLFATVEGVGALSQCPIVDKATSAKRSRKMRLLIGRRIETKSIACLHKNIVHLVSNFVKPKLWKVWLKPAEAGAFLPAVNGLGFQP